MQDMTLVNAGVTDHLQGFVTKGSLFMPNHKIQFYDEKHCFEPSVR